MSIDSNCSAKRLNLERATNFMRQFRDPDSRELKKLSANQFMEVWSHYDRDGNGYIEGTELDGFLKEFVSSANFTDISPDMSSLLALALLAVFAAISDSSVILSNVNSDSFDVPPYVNSDSSDVLSPRIIEYSEVIDSFSNDVYVIPSSLSTDPLEVYSSKNSDISVISAASRTTNLYAGSIGSADRRLLLVNVNRAPIANTIQRQTIEYRRANNAPIRAVRAFETRSNQGASVAITGGGIGQTFLRITITSRVAGSIYYQVDFWGP